MLCIPIIAGNTEEALNKMAVATPLADVMEFRLDLMESFNLDVMVSAAVKPVIVTYRSVAEGGRGEADPSIVTDYLISGINAGASFVDLELSLPRKHRAEVLNTGRKTDIIISTHFNDTTPSRRELEDILNRSIEEGGDMVKIITMARKWEDNFRVLELIPAARERGIKIIAFCMGIIGRMSRIFSLLMGASMTFVSLQTGQESAPGQVPVGEMKRMLEYFSK